jgi:NTE family protein
MSRPESRAGLVLGAGGVLGAAWMAGALAALQARLPYPVEDTGLILGTSAGSVLAAALRCGFGVDDLVAHQRGTGRGALDALCAPDLSCRGLPPWPSWCPGSPRLMLKALRAPSRVHPWVTAAACLPRGRARHDELRRTVSDMMARHRRGPGAGDRGQTWITAVDYDSGRRVVFGRDGAPEATLPDAVVASCSVPCWYQPAVIGSHRYIDGGVRSGSNADLLARAGIAKAYVLAPAASLVAGPPRGLTECLERFVRRLMTRALLKEVALLRGRGIDVTVLTPGPADLAAMGGNLMDHRRREAVFETSLRTSAAAMSGRRNLRRAGRRRVSGRVSGPARRVALQAGESAAHG